ncbi:MAG: YqgE/AlgH family protein [Flavobacteriaceae bacterium]|nr:MAG: YqgE/AlgH family protein [Flavobacteriaceae bacterium]
MTTLKPTKGKLLVAEPSILSDSSFNRSVVLLTEHNESGSVGFIFNKPSPYKIGDLIPDIDSSLKVYFGGPVSEDNLYFVHKVPELIPDSIEIADGIFWGGDFEAIQSLLKDDILSKHDIRFFLGYSGWSHLQLEEELETTSWLIVENKFKNLFKINPNNFWKNELMKYGGVYRLWANAPKDPGMN